MHIADLSIMILYILAMLGVGIYFSFRNKTADDYFVGGRKMSSLHIGLSVVATDVGGGFSIGLGGLGFIMGLSGSWMLFTGLVGAWLSAVLLIPMVKGHKRMSNFLTFPQMFRYLYNKPVALLAGIISGIGYVGFTGSQLLAGAKLTSATFPALDMQTAIWIMGAVAVIYTALGGLKAVIYTDTVQWIILMGGLIFLGIPIAWYAVGGWESISAALGPEFFSLGNVRWQTLVNWAVTIIPIWFVGMTLYQRIYASRDVKTAKRAWYMAGLFEYPVMAFMGVILGMLARVAFQDGMFAHLGFPAGSDMDAEMGLPLLLRNVLPVGIMGLMLAAYFSAILSTADSCLMAASGNFLSDILKRFLPIDMKGKNIMLISQGLTLALGSVAVLIALNMRNVLDLMLYSYAFMVSGLFVPVIAGLSGRRQNPVAALVAMIGGGLGTLLLILTGWPLPLELEPNIFGIAASALLFLAVKALVPVQR